MDVREQLSDGRLMTPTRILVLLALVTLALFGAFLVAYLSGPSTITLDISAPVGETVVCHVLVDGRAEAYEDVVPVVYHFDAHEFAYAVVGKDVAAGDLTFSASDSSGSGAVNTAAGVKGTFNSHWWGSAWRHEHMTSTHVTNMRRSAAQQQEETEGNEANEVQSLSPR